MSCQGQHTSHCYQTVCRCPQQTAVGRYSLLNTPTKNTKTSVPQLFQCHGWPVWNITFPQESNLHLNKLLYFFWKLNQWRHQTVNSCCCCVTHDLSSQAHFHSRGQVGASLYSIWIMPHLLSLYSFSMCSHLAKTGRWLPICPDSKCTSYFRHRLPVHISRCGWSYIVATAWIWNWKNDFLMVAPNSSWPWHCRYSCHRQ